MKIGKPGRQMQKIGMCCACGDDCPKSQTIRHHGCEYCPRCAEVAGIADSQEAGEAVQLLRDVGQ